MSKENLRQSEANVTENRDRPTQHRHPTADLSLFSTCYMFA